MLDNTVPIKVLDHGKVELVDYMGSDLAIVQAAQSSFSKFSLEFGDREYRILRSLMREEHGVPFEHVTLKFRLDIQLFVARQLVKHRTSSWSEKSARYSEMFVEFYIPEVEHVRSQLGKPMEYRYEVTDDEVAQDFVETLAHWCNEGRQHQERFAKAGIAREMSRFFVPINAYTTVTWTMNGRGLLNMLHLRNDEHTQWETRQFAIAMESLAETVIPETMKAFNEFGRKVP